MVAVGLLVAGVGGPVRAGITDEVYAIGYNTENLYSVNQATGAITSLYTAYPGAASVTLAQRASDGRVFYVAGTAANGQLYSWNPATPAAAPVAVGTGLGATVPALYKLAFASGGTLYGMNTDSTRVYSISTTTGTATQIGSGYTAVGSGGDFAFRPSNGTLYMVVGTSLYTVSTTGSGTHTLLGAITGGGISGNLSGVALD